MAEELKKTGQGGMSSEELDNFTNEEEPVVVPESEEPEPEPAAEEPAAEEPAAEPEPKETPTEESAVEEPAAEPEPEADPKDAVIGDYRRRARESDRRNAELEALLATERARAKTETTETEVKSPLEKYIEEHGDEEPLDGKTLQAQKVFEARQAEKATKKAAADESIANNRAGLAYARQNLSEAKKGKGLDFETIIGDFSHHLDEGDRMMCEKAGPKALIEAYNRIITNVLNADDEDAAILKARIKAHNSKAKPKTKETTKPKTTKGEPEEPYEDLRASTVHIMDGLDMFVD